MPWKYLFDATSLSYIENNKIILAIPLFPIFQKKGKKIERCEIRHFLPIFSFNFTNLGKPYDLVLFGEYRGSEGQGLFRRISNLSQLKKATYRDFRLAGEYAVEKLSLLGDSSASEEGIINSVVVERVPKLFYNAYCDQLLKRSDDFHGRSISPLIELVSSLKEEGVAIS